MDYNELTSALNEMKLVDLTFSMEQGMPVWPTHPQFYHDPVESVLMGDMASHFTLFMGEHCGTHLDAPFHFIPEGTSVDNVSLRSFYGKAVKIEATDKKELGLLTERNIREWETSHVEIKEQDIVLIHFGWDSYWNVKPACKQFLSNWPGLAEDGAKYLAKKKVKAVGTDALALDVFGDDANPTHKELLGNSIIIIENLSNLGNLPDTFFFFTLPLKIKGGSGSPVRAIAFIKK